MVDRAKDRDVISRVVRWVVVDVMRLNRPTTYPTDTARVIGRKENRRGHVRRYLCSPGGFSAVVHLRCHDAIMRFRESRWDVAGLVQLRPA